MAPHPIILTEGGLDRGLGPCEEKRML
ncbi:alpha/beta hydrolase family protein [Bacteroides fragilis]|nr:alpha/beta hydrolase family protein [Bacteroides fragilis]